MTNYKFGLMEYSIIIQRKRRIEFLKKNILPHEVLNWYE